MKIPITIRPTFWIFSTLIALLFSDGNLIRGLIWVGIIFISVLFHELGHALMAVLFGQKPRIELVAMGGLTVHDGDRLPFWKQFLITLNGPLFGFILGLVAYFIALHVPSLPVKGILSDVWEINWFWTAINLLPILPLDGGQLLRIVLEGIFRAKGVRYALIAGAGLSFAAATFFFLQQAFFPGAIFFLFAFDNFDGFRKTKMLRDRDRGVSLKTALMQAEMELQRGNKEGALAAFEALRKEAKEGLIYSAATQYAAFLDYELGKKHEAYAALKELQERLDPQGLYLLHQVAFDENDFPLVSQLAADAFQVAPHADVALRSAYAFGTLGQVEPTIGWLESALTCGVENMQEIVQEKAFDPVRSDPRFQSFLAKL